VNHLAISAIPRSRLLGIVICVFGVVGVACAMSGQVPGATGHVSITGTPDVSGFFPGNEPRSLVEQAAFQLTRIPGVACVRVSTPEELLGGFEESAHPPTPANLSQSSWALDIALAPAVGSAGSPARLNLSHQVASVLRSQHDAEHVLTSYDTMPHERFVLPKCSSY
jgi:hypothetical protein